MQTLGIAFGIVAVVMFLLLANTLGGWFTDMNQINLIYIAITLLGAAVLISAFGRH